MPKNPHADFSPVLDGYSGIGAFRFWCQTALPLTYDDSLSYYELLNKVVNYLNHTIEDLTAVESNTSALAEAYNKLQKYVNDYFDDLDIEAELRNVLDAMAEDGTLDSLLDPIVENQLPGVVEEKIDGVVAEQIDGAVAGQIDESVAEQLPPLVNAGIAGEVSDWLDDNVEPVGSAVVVDNSLTISGAAADAKVTGDKLNETKTQLNALCDYNFWSYGTIAKGYAVATLSTESDLRRNENYNTTDFIPVKPGDIIYGKGSRFKTYDSEKVKQYSAIFSQLTTELQNGYKYYIIPEGISYFRVCDEIANGIFFIAKVNPYEYWIKNFIDNYINKIPTIETKVENMKEQLNLQYNDNFWSYGNISKNYAIANRLTEPDLSPNTDFNTTDYIPVIPGDIIYGKGARFKTYDSEKTAIYTAIFSSLSTELQNGWKYYVIPEGVAYFRICNNNTTGTFLVAKVNPYEFWINNKIDNFDLGDIEERIAALENPPKTKTLYAIGDSITRGMYAEYGASASTGPTPLNYVYWLGEIKHFNVVNLGESGGGYAQKGTQTNSNGKDIVDNNNFENADIVIIALGINDYKHSPDSSTIISLGDMTSQSGDGSVIGNMKYMIENIYNKAPTANIIIMLPMNQNRFGYNNMSFENNWSMGYAFRENKTLTDYRNAIKECADYYNLTVIDEEFVTPINRYNIRYCLGDGLHPTRAFYKRMAQAFAPFIE